ncbi:MAG: EamA family transporter [candidate division SR1 bacterium CG_4_9_14_3_um_filter_40_9]|nr:MAG: EamA family transporter [candidate division SR1 bacterium CG_4_9_14_3_um_filter_40_9]
MFKRLKINKRTALGAGAIMLAALFRSLDGIFLRPQFYTLPAVVVVFLEHILGFLVLLPWLVKRRWKIKVLSRNDWFAIIGVSVLGGLIGTVFITKAFFAAFGGQITLATVILLQKLQPVFALILARIILKEKLPAKFYVRALLAIGSGYVLAFGQDGLNVFSIQFWHHAAFYSLIAAFAFGAGTVLGKKVVNNLDFQLTAGLRFGITSILAFIVLLVTGDLGSISLLTPHHRISLVIIVFTSGALAMFLYYFGLKRVKASQATILELFRPLSAVILDYFLNGNILTPAQMTATIILLFAIYQIVKSQNKLVSFSANVVHGQGRGFHTANLDVINLELPHGIYLIDMSWKGKKYKGLMHFGYRATFHEAISTELYLANFDGDLYRQHVKVTVQKKIRDIIEFPTAEALKAQIAKDMEQVK